MRDGLSVDLDLGSAATDDHELSSGLALTGQRRALLDGEFGHESGNRFEFSFRELREDSDFGEIDPAACLRDHVSLRLRGQILVAVHHLSCIHSHAGEMGAASAVRWRTFGLSTVMQDVPVAPNEDTETDPNASAFAIRRIAAYLCVCIALAVVIWALVEGGDRDTWTQASVLLAPSFARWAA